MALAQNVSAARRSWVVRFQRPTGTTLQDPRYSQDNKEPQTAMDSNHITHIQRGQPVRLHVCVCVCVW